MQFLTLILSLPTENATLRMRAWRALKAAGAPALRDGVYLLPDTDPCRAVLSGIVAEVIAGGGAAFLLSVDEAEDRFVALFDRSDDYAALATQAAALLAGLSPATANEALKSSRRLRKTFMAIGDTDYFPGEARPQIHTLLTGLEQAIARTLSPDEPRSGGDAIEQRTIAGYQGRVWATRKRPWVDRLASAWLVRRFIDPTAKIIWLETPADCPADGLGFDFDGATFTHTEGLVTFEVIAASFAIDTTAVRRLGALVHFLDVGGLQPPEASGVETVLKGMRDAIADDDHLLAIATTVFDGLLNSFGAAHG